MKGTKEKAENVGGNGREHETITKGETGKRREKIGVKEVRIES